MKDLLISIEREGKMIPAGSISRDSPSHGRFCYSEEYLNNYTVPISISLPLQKQEFSEFQTKSFFEGLLPEGFTRRSVAQWMHVDENDYLEILHGLGKECLGAVCISEEGDIPEASYERITEDQVRLLAAEGARKSAELVTRSHLSLTGASGKAGLYYNAGKKEWYLPRGTAPSTHIVKQSHIRLREIVTNEQLCIYTAARCGITVPESFIINTGKGREQEILFATKRYDRIFGNTTEMINDLPRPFRLHQEDFAQAMGIPASQKYENGHGKYLKGMFDIIRKYSGNPVADQLKLWDIVVFNYLIGNTDAHIKNFSLLYTPDLRTVRLAPAYDIVSTAVYEQSTRDMAFSIGEACSIDDVSEESFRQAAGETGLGEKTAMKRYDFLCGCFEGALHESARELYAAGYPGAAEIEERILRNGGIREPGL